MMDELELLKKDWQRKGERLPKLSYEELYKMLWKKSSTIVKWIFYISILEFLFWTAINIVATDTEFMEDIRRMHLYEVNIILNILSYGILVYFIYRFYRNYRKISVTDSARQLMKTILNVKKTVTQYVWFNISLFAVSLMITLYASLRYMPDGQKIVEAATDVGDETFFWIVIIGASLIIVGLFVILIWLFYKVLYGILLKRLRQNYKDLEALEV